jgi:hypothetical protein
VPQAFGSANSFFWQEVTVPSSTSDKINNKMYTPRSEYVLSLRYFGFSVIITHGMFYKVCYGEVLYV